jgi:hypothetical protein
MRMCDTVYVPRISVRKDVDGGVAGACELERVRKLTDANSQMSVSWYLLYKSRYKEYF